MSESDKDIYEYEADRANGKSRKSFMVVGLASVLGFGVITASAIGLTSAPATPPVLDGKPLPTESSEAPVASQTQPQEAQTPNPTTSEPGTQPQFGTTEDEDFEDDENFAGPSVSPQFGGSNFDDREEDEGHHEGRFGHKAGDRGDGSFGHGDEDEYDHEDDEGEHEGHENS